MTLEKSKAQHLIQDLRYLGQCFTDACDACANQIHDSQASNALEECNHAIDKWNALINQAPRVLKAIKQEYLEKLVYGED